MSHWCPAKNIFYIIPKKLFLKENNFFFFFFGSTGVWTESFTFARKVYYHLHHYPIPKKNNI
jgi:hypothetical protein